MEQNRVQYVLQTLQNPKKLEEKLLPLVEECVKMSVSNSLGWALLAKLIYACSQEMLNTIKSRVQKRLIAATKQSATVSLLHFIRSFLVRFPSLKNYNEQSLAYLCSRAVDFSIANRSEDITNLASDIYALWTGDKHDHVLVAVLKNVFNDGIIETTVSEKMMLHFNTPVEGNLVLASTIFILHTRVIERSTPGSPIAINEWLDVACEAVATDDNELKNSVFRWLTTFLNRTKSTAHLAVCKISAFISDFYYPSRAYYETVKEYVRLGPNLSLKSLFERLINDVSYHLHSQEYGKFYAEALGTMLELRPYLLDVRDVIQLQQIVCQEAFQNRDCKPALSLLNSLLSMNHELAPSPIQIAQSIFNSSDNWCDEVRLGRALCSAISRPMIHALVSKEHLVEKTDIVNGDQRSSHNRLSSDNAEQSYNDTVENMLISTNSKVCGTKSDENIDRKRHSLLSELTEKRLRAALSGVDNSSFIEKTDLYPSHSDTSDMEQVSDDGILINREPDNPVLKSDILKLESAFREKRNSDIDIEILEENRNGEKLSVQQMMNDFVPTLKNHMFQIDKR
ncbi:unnamed protein product [Thelazia callipaeda]|uniref:Non-specific serine/threonine protein kinase n=1 Tax=Thelazia callipaeda TaxID=103827 RepID=A0A0N5CU97_THECL|nr:unnamed protein product [Thelazia callipaeda]